jgi:hypothetical protein
MWGVVWGARMILKVAVPGPVRDTSLRERPARKVLGQRSDLAEVQPSGGVGHVGPEQLIKMATGQLPDVYGMRLRPPRQWRHL